MKKKLIEIGFRNHEHWQEAMGLRGADTRTELIDSILPTQRWTEDLIRLEETAGALEVIEGKPRKQAKGRIDYTPEYLLGSQRGPRDALKRQGEALPNLGKRGPKKLLGKKQLRLLPNLGWEVLLE